MTPIKQLQKNAETVNEFAGGKAGDWIMLIIGGLLTVRSQKKTAALEPVQRFFLEDGNVGFHIAKAMQHLAGAIRKVNAERSAKEVCGHPNHATWTASLIIDQLDCDNDVVRGANEWVKSLDRPEDRTVKMFRHRMADMLQEKVEEFAFEHIDEGNLQGQMLRSAMNEVDWLRLASHTDHRFDPNFGEEEETA